MKLKFIATYIRDNRWSTATIIVSTLILFIIVRDLVHACQINVEIGRLEVEKREYQASITRDSTLLERIKSDDGLVRYAREEFYMKRDNEDVYILK